MSRPVAVPTVISNSAAEPATPQGRRDTGRPASSTAQPSARLRNVLHLLMVLSMLLSTFTPLLVPQAASAASGSAGTLKVTLPPEAKAIPPYRAGMQPAEEARALAPAASPQAASAAETSAIETSALGTELAPGWLSMGATGEARSAPVETTALAPDWLALAAAGEERGAPVETTALAPDWLQSASTSSSSASSTTRSPAASPSALPFALPLALPLALQAGSCSVSGLQIAGDTPLAVSQGDTTTPYTFTTVITNSSYALQTGALSLTIQVPANFYFIGNSASAVSRLGSPLTINQPPLNLSAGTPAVIIVNATPESATLPQGDVITVTYRLAANTGGAPNPTLTTNLAIRNGQSACSVSQTINSSLCPLEVRLPMQVETPPYLVSRGNFAGDIYTVTVRNTGTTTATDVSFEVNPNVGFFFVANSAGGTHSQYGGLTIQQPASNTTPDTPFVLRVANPYPVNTLAPGAAVTVTMRLGTNGDAKSGQPLTVTLRSGVTDPQVCSTIRENIATARGNLVIAKLPDVQTGRLGDIITWTVQLRNTGLGSIYDTVFTEAPDAGVQVISVTPAATTTTEIKPDQSVLYTVTARVNACVGLRNEARGSWNIGNIDSTGLVTNPVSDDAFISYLYEDPNITVAVQPLADLDFCGQPQRTVVATVTNPGGPVRNMALRVEENGSFVVTPQGPNWVRSGNVISYTANGGILPGDTAITLSLNISFTAPVCAQNSGSFVLTPFYSLACPVGDPPQDGQPTTVQLQSDAPSLAVEKTASQSFAEPGDTIYYTVTVSGRNPVGEPVGPIYITDTLPAIFENATILRSDSSGPASSDDMTITVAVTPTSTPLYTETLFITATYPVSGACGFGIPQANLAEASGTSCPDCLEDDASHLLYVTDPGPLGGGYFRVQSQQVAICGPTVTQQNVEISITNGITWAGSSYADPLGGGGLGPLTVVPGSVQVFVDGMDRTSAVTVTTAPTLGIQLDNIGSFSPTALITISYQVTAGDEAAAGSGVYYVRFIQGGYDDLDVCGVNRRAPVALNIDRAALNNLGVDPGAIRSCNVNTVVLTVDGEDLDQGVTDQVVVTFTTNISDVFTPTAPSLVLGGAFAGETPTVVTGVQGSSRIVTFTFDPGLDVDEAGTISFPLYRPCGVDTPFNVRLSYADACRITQSEVVTGAARTLQSNVVLRAPQITYTVDTDALTWQFSIRNSGEISAANVFVTNTLPFGIRFSDLVSSGVPAPFLAAISVTTGTVGGREVVSITVPEFPQQSSIQFTVNSVVDTCNPQDSIWIRLTQPCGGVGNTCGGSQMERLGVQQGIGALLTSNTQQANIPLCSAGNVRLIVKNASAQTDLFDFFVQQFLTDVTYVTGTATIQLIRADGTFSPSIPFTPTLVSPANPTIPYRQTLEWDVADMGSYPPAVRAYLEARRPGDRLIIDFDVNTFCTAVNPSVQGYVQAVNACSTYFEATEDSSAVLVADPTLDLDKQVRNVTENTGYAPSVFAGQGDTIVWKVDVANTSVADVNVLYVTDTLPGWFNYIDSYTTPTQINLPILQWRQYTGTTSGSPLPAEGSTTFWITGTVGASACTDLSNNIANAIFGCTDDDLCPSPAYTATAGVNTAPNFSVVATDLSFDQCSAGPLSFTFANTGARAGGVVVSYTLPAGYIYTGLAPGTTPTPLTSPAGGSTGLLTFTYGPIPQQQVTNTVRMSITRDTSLPNFCLNSGTVTATLSYTDSCGIQRTPVTDTGSLTVLRSDISTLNQQPVTRTVDAGVRYTWTLNVPNTGAGPTNNLVVTDILPVGLQFVTATIGSSPGSTVTAPVITNVGGETIIVWNAGRVPAGETWIARVSAIPLYEETNYTLVAEAHTECDDGGCQQTQTTRSYAGPVQGLDKQVSAAKVSIAEPFFYTITAEFYGNLTYTNTQLVDVLPRLAGRVVFSYTDITITNTNPANSWSAIGSTPGLITFTTPLTTPSGNVDGPDRITITVSGIISNDVAAQENVFFTNTVNLYYNYDGVRFLITDSVPAQIKEPVLIVDKQVSPTSVDPGDVVFYSVRIYHSLTSTAVAYNVVISDIIPPGLSYIDGTWEADNSPPELADTGTYSDVGNTVEAYFPVISQTVNITNPLILTFQAVVDVTGALGSLITNTVTTTWESWPTDPYDEVRDGSGGVNDYRDSDDAIISLDDFSLVKTGPITATAGGLITYVVTLFNNSGFTATGAVMTDTMPFQVIPVTATFVAPLAAGACNPPFMAGNLPNFSCPLGTMPPYSRATVVLTGTVRPETPDGSVLYNYARATLYDSNNQVQTLEDDATTIVNTTVDLGIKKTGPITAMAGDLITYTLVLTNSGPSWGQEVDVKDELPPGVTFVSGSSTQGICVSAICQLGDVAPGGTVTMVITASVGSGVSGVITNTGTIFSSNADSNPNNNSSSFTTTVRSQTVLYVAKTDLTDPVYAGDTYIYQVVVTNTGPATAFNVRVTDTLPSAALFEGASPGCTYTGSGTGGVVSCAVGDMLPDSWYTFLINVRVPQTVTNGTVVTNTVVVTTTTPVVTATSVLSDSEQTTWLQAVGSPTDLAISKRVAGSPTIAGGSAPITYTMVVTNNGPAAASAVQVSDFFPPQFTFVSIQSSRPLTQGQCSNGGVCDLGAMAVGQTATITLVMRAPANVAAGVYTNTAFVNSPAPDSNPNNNSSSVPTTVNVQSVLQARKEANPNPAVVGGSLSYVIFITNTGPSNANNVTVSDTLPVGFFPSLIVSSQGSCAALPCNIGTLTPGQNAWVQLYGTVASTVTQASQLANTARITATEFPTGVQVSVTPTISTTTALVVHKTQTAPAGSVAAGGLVTYTITVTNSGPGLAHSVDVKDQLPTGLTPVAVSAQAGYCAGALCQFGNLPAGSSRTMTVVALVDSALAAGVVTNTAAAFSPDAPPVTDTVTTTVTTNANLDVTKTALNSPVNAGEVLFYQVVVSNNGPSDAQNVQVTDTLPAGTTYVGGDAACSANGNIVTCSIGTLAAGSTRTLLINANVSANLLDGTLLTNAVTVTTPTTTTVVTDTTTTTVTQPSGNPADLSLVKTGALTATAGETVRYTLTVTNSGPATATAAYIVDALPSGVSFVAASSSVGLCESGVTCQLGDLPVGGTATVVVTGLVRSDVLTGSLLVNNAQVGGSNPDNNLTNNSDSFTTTAHALALLTLVKDANAAAVLVGDQVQYRIVVTNSGPSTAQDVVVADILPAGLANPLVSSSQGGCSGFPCDLGDLEPGAAATIIIQGLAALNGTLNNTASVTTSTDLRPGSVLSDSALVTAIPYADLAIVKDATPTAIAGGQIVYTLTVVNNGPSTARFITVTDALPAQTTFVSASNGCTQIARVVTCNFDNLSAGARASFHITVTAAANITPGSSIENRAAVTAATLDPTPANNNDTADTSIVARAALVIDKRASAANVAAGGFVTYTIVVTNNGPSAAGSVDVKDQLPTGLTPVAVSAQGGVCAGALCQFGSLPVGAVRIMTVVARVDSALAAGVVTNTAAVFSPDAPPVTDTVTTTVSTSATLRIEKVALGSPSVAGGQQSYQVVVSNDGPSDARNVVVTDTLPAGTTYAGGDLACSANGGTLVCALGNLPAGAQRTLLVNVNVAASLLDGSLLTNVVTATSPTVQNPVTDSVTTPVQQPQGGVVDLAVTKRGPLTATAGAAIAYTLLITNNGPATAQSVQVVDALPLSVTFVAATSSVGTCDAGVTCQLGDLPAGGTATIVITGLVQSNVLTGSLLVNNAQTASSNPDSNPNNNTDSFTTTAQALALLTLVKDANAAAVLVGQQVQYRVVVTNSGPSTAQDVVVADILPAGLSNPLVSSSQGGCSGFPCTLGDLQPGAAATILVVGIAAANGTLNNTASVTTSTDLRPGSVLSDSAVVVVSPYADLALIKDAVATVEAGSQLVYTLTVVNNGPSTARFITVTDALPAQTAFVSASNGCTQSGGVVTCNLNSLAAGARASFRITVGTAANITPGSSIENRATVAAATLDPAPANNSDTADTSIIARSTLAIDKRASAANVTAGEFVTYTIVVTNSGPSAATSVDVKDELPVGLNLISVKATDGGVCAGAICQFGSLPVGATRTMIVVAQADPSLLSGVVTNTAAAFSPNAPTVTDTVPTTVDNRVLLWVDKQASATVVTPGDSLSYRIIVYNAGPSTARNVVMNDLLPAGLINPMFSSSRGSCSANACELGDLLPGETVTILVTALVSQAANGRLVNTAQLTSTSPLDPGSVLSDTVSTPVNSIADVMIAKAATPAVKAGQRITYVVNVYNAGPSTATRVQVLDRLPASTTLAVLDPNCQASVDGTAFRCPVQPITLNVGGMLTFTVVVTANAALPSGSVLQNNAEVSSATPDPNPANNRADASTNISAQADFALVKNGPATVIAGGYVTYVITVTNNGPSYGNLQDIKDTLPPSLTLVSAALQRTGGGLTACAGTICQTAGPVAVGEVMTMTVVAYADPSLPPGMVLTNTATVFPGDTTPDPVEGNNQDNHITPVSALAQIAIDKWDLIDPVYPDSLVVYVLSVANVGPSVARGLVITDVLPAGVTYMSSTDSCVEGPAGVLTCQVGSLPPGGRTSFQVLVHVDPGVPNGTRLHNVATLTSTTPLTNSILEADEDTLVKAPTGPLADLEISKAATPLAVRNGDLVTFTIVITNNGPSPVSSAQVLDLLPDGLQLVRVQPSQGYCNGGINCLLGALNYVTATAQGPEVRGTADITVVARAENSLLVQQIVTNTVYVQSELVDPKPENNYAEAPVILLPAGPHADVQIKKLVEQAVFHAGDLITYTLLVYNAGPSPAQNVVVEDPMPFGVTFVNAQPAPSAGLPNAPRWNLGLMQPNDRVVISVIVRSDPGAQAGLLIRNTATVTTTTRDPVPSNNVSTAESQVFGSVDIEVQKTANPTAPLAGGLVTYTIVITNHGPSAAHDVDIKDSLPPSVSLVSMTPERGVCVSQICQFGVMSAGEQIVVTATVLVDPSVPPGTVLTNTVTGFTDTPDTNPGNNQDKEPIIVGPLVNLQVSKLSQQLTATVGTEITYTIIVTNYGPAVSPNVIVTDIVPAGFVYRRTTNPLGCTNDDRRFVVCPVGTLGVQQVASFDIAFFIESVSPISVTNRVVVEDPDAYDPDGEGQGEITTPTDPTGPSAVTLARFNVMPQGNALLVTWETLLEIDSWSFRLWRSTVNDRSTAELITPEPLLARGSGSIYTYLDTNVQPKVVYYYWLQEIATNNAQKEIDLAWGGIDLPGTELKLYLPSIQKR